MAEALIDYVVVESREVVSYLQMGYSLYGNMTTIFQPIQGNYGPDYIVIHYQAMVK